MMPFEGEAFLHSQINERPSFLRAFSNSNMPLGNDNAFSLISESGIFSDAVFTLSLA